ncbi:MAG TPA: nucleotidyltransferase domain-containing protein [Ignavibacteriaceae bacterium]|nr:nucleotidyltransferase domain-containing protein [Ignavibacteriaceae bacterium]
MDIVNKEKITDVLLKRENISFAYLFGSQAKNKTRFRSDLDIALYFKNDPGLGEIGALVVELENTSDCKVDIVSLKNLYEKNPKLAYSVIAEGNLLFCKDKLLLSHFKKNVFLYYLDFKPVIDLFTDKLYERLSNGKFAVAEQRPLYPRSGRNK